VSFRLRYAFSIVLNHLNKPTIQLRHKKRHIQYATATVSLSPEYLCTEGDFDGVTYSGYSATLGNLRDRLSPMFRCTGNAQMVDTIITTAR
jgi:hypothetical protein